MSQLRLSGLRKSFGKKSIVDGLDLEVHSGEFVSLLGPSGCGKTTLLRMIAGLTDCDSGSICLGDREITKVPAHKRNIGVVFQNYALFPHLTVGENIAFGMRAHGMPSAGVAKKVIESLESVQLCAYADRPIHALSGGEQQRVAVARALATRPGLLLLDEPLSALDRKLRGEMQLSLRRILREAGITAIFVTHDQDEALVMSDRIAVMNGGAVEHLGTPSEVYNRPQSLFTLDFVGLSAQLYGDVEDCRDGVLTVRTAAGTVRAPASFIQGSRVVLGVRPESMRLGALPPHADMNSLDLTVSETVYLGSRRLVYFGAGDRGDAVRVIAELAGSAEMGPLRAGDRLQVHWPVSSTLAYPGALP